MNFRRKPPSASFAAAGNSSARISLTILAASSVVLGWGVATRAVNIQVSGCLLAWPTLALAASAVEHLAARRRKATLARALLALTFGLPIFACAWMPAAWICTAILGPYRDVDTVITLCTTVPPVLIIGTLASLALERPLPLLVALLGSAIVFGAAHAIPPGDARVATTVWTSIASATGSLLIGFLASRGRFLPGQCMTCGYELTGLPMHTACPECGQSLPPA